MHAQLRELLTEARIEWHVVRPHQPDWGVDSHSLALSVQDGRRYYYLAMNAYWEPLPFELGLVRNHYVGRTFISPDQRLRVAFAGVPGSFAEYAVLAAYPGAEAAPEPVAAVPLAPVASAVA